MYSTSLELRPLTVSYEQTPNQLFQSSIYSLKTLEWFFTFIGVAVAIMSMLLGCYFTYMARHGKSRMFQERLHQIEG